MLGGLQAKVELSLSRSPCCDLRKQEPARFLGEWPQHPISWLMLLYFSVGPVLMFITAKLFHKLEIEIGSDFSFSFPKFLMG